MVLEALAAVSLATSVLQFIDFSAKIISKGNQYYKTGDGSCDEDKKLQAVGQNLETLSRDLKASMKPLTTFSKLTQAEQALCDIASECENTGFKLKAAVDDLRKSGSQTKWKSFRQALKSQWKRDEIEATLRELRMVREDLVIHLLVVTQSVSQ